jgi:Snf7
MNCLVELVAGAYIGVQRKLCMRITDDPLHKAEEELEVCRYQLSQRVEQLRTTAACLHRDVLAKRLLGQHQGAMQKYQEYKRCQSHLTKVGTGIALIDRQLDLLHNNDLDNQLMWSLKQSTKAMRAAGIKGTPDHAESVMMDLEEQVREANAITSVLTHPLEGGMEDEDLERELDLLMAAGEQPPTFAVSMQPGPADVPAAQPAPPARGDFAQTPLMGGMAPIADMA